MGVPKLLSTLTPHGERKQLNGACVVIDGPALAYFAVGLCMADPALSAGRNHPLDQPTYGQLGDAAVAWLDKLQSFDIEVNVIYFDGYLPKGKRPVRLERSYRTSSQLKDVYGFYQKDNLPGLDVKGPRTGSLLPAPPFAVPAVLDALRDSPVYGPATLVVPGEADAFCAQSARSKAGATVITSDSDLLVQDLGPDSQVVLFRDLADVNRAAQGSTLVVPAFSMPTISRRLGFPSDRQGIMVDFAFELFMDAHLSTTELAELAKKGSARERHRPEYDEFAEQFAFPRELAASVKAYDINKLDPRVSELVVQSLFPDEGRSHDLKAKTKAKAKAGEILVFQPPLLDNCTRTNAWEASSSIRCCAYSLLRILAGRPIQHVREYARMATMATRGTLLDLLPAADLGEHLSQLLNAIRQTDTLPGATPVVKWATLASWQSVRWSQDNGKDAIALEVLCKGTDAGGILSRVTWDAVHWLSEIQATLYSLRILTQVLHFLLDAQKTQPTKPGLAIDAALATMLSALDAALAASSIVPALKDYPTLQSLRDLPAKMREFGALRLLAKLAKLPDSVRFEADAKKSKNRNKNKKRKRSDPSASSASRGGANPFSVLGVE